MLIAVLRDRLAPDAPADEADNLVQARAVTRALEALGHRVQDLDCGLDLGRVAAALAAERPDAVFNLVEALDGRDTLAPAVPALLDSLGLPHTGSGALPLAAAADKLRAKRLLRRLGLPTPDWFERADLADPAAAPSGPFLLKPRLEHGSVGIEESDLLPAPDRAALDRALAAKEDALGQPCIAEAYLPGREFNVSVLDGPHGPEVLPPAEMLFTGYGPDKPRILGWRAKWDEASFEHGHTERTFDLPPADAPLAERLRALALACFQALDMVGYARVDFRLDRLGAPQAIDLNPNPCIAPDAGFPAAAARAGLSYQDTVARILAAALPARSPESPA